MSGQSRLASQDWEAFASSQWRAFSKRKMLTILVASERRQIDGSDRFAAGRLCGTSTSI